MISLNMLRLEVLKFKSFKTIKSNSTMTVEFYVSNNE